MEPIIGLGIMSGTSLDGLDLCLTSFERGVGGWQYKILDAKTVQYSSSMRERLVSIFNANALDLVLFENEYGRFIGSLAKEFISKHDDKPSFIASHGHTIFHQPAIGMTKQIGSGAEIAAITGITTVCDFRSLDVALGGQGAPLVPIGDELLFSKYDYCLNLGGFANISTRRDGKRLAYDICPVNIILSHFTRAMGCEFDDGGLIAASGVLNETLLGKLNALFFYSANIPKSLGREWVEQQFLPVVLSCQMDVNDILRTLVEHCAVQLSKSVDANKSVLVTGGGAYNRFLVDRFSAISGANVIIPDDNTIQFKEALIFAFLGLLRMNNQINTLKTVTGAVVDSIGGCVYL